MAYKEIRLLRADEIDIRQKQTSKDGKKAMYLLYKDARCDMAILDETFGSLNWKREHGRDNANCIVSVWDDSKGQWVSKEDTGTESNTEKEKGLASDSFKRACFNWCIGRELYTAPQIWIPTTFNQYDLKVTYVKYNERREIVALEIKDGKGQLAYSYPERAYVREVQPAPAQQKAAQPAKNDLPENAQAAGLTLVQYRALCGVLTLESDWAELVFGTYSAGGVQDLTGEQLKRVYQRACDHGYIVQ